MVIMALTTDTFSCPSIPGSAARRLTVNQRLRDTTATEPKAQVICFPDPMTMVALGGVEADGVAGIAMVMEATSIDSPINSLAPVRLCTMANVTWNRCGP